MENTYKCPPKKAFQLLEIEKLLKFNQEILEGFIRPVEEEILVLTIIGTTTSNPNLVANKILLNYYNDEELTDLFPQESYKPGIWAFTDLLNIKSNNNTKIIILTVNGIEKKEFTPRIFGMIHAISSIILCTSDKANLSDLEVISNFRKVFTGTSYPDDIIKNLSPKFLFCYMDDENNSNFTVNEITNYIEKEDIISESFNKFYREKKAFILVKTDLYQKNSDEKFDSLIKILFVDSLSKSYRGKKLNGLTLRNMFIEFVNCINQNIGFNINKM